MALHTPCMHLILPPKQNLGKRLTISATYKDGLTLSSSYNFISDSGSTGRPISNQPPITTTEDTTNPTTSAPANPPNNQSTISQPDTTQPTEITTPTTDYKIEIATISKDNHPRYILLTLDKYGAICPYCNKNDFSLCTYTINCSRCNRSFSKILGKCSYCHREISVTHYHPVTIEPSLSNGSSQNASATLNNSTITSTPPPSYQLVKTPVKSKMNDTQRWNMTFGAI